jgi:hypothetical protein
MLRATLLCFCVFAAGASADAADMPGNSRLGKVFVEKAKPDEDADSRYRFRTEYAPEVDVSPLTQGYYGKLNSYHYKSYYGTPFFEVWGRLPYTCGLLGYC